MIHEIYGDATRPTTEGLKIIAHICNDRRAWGAGFVLEISKRWPEPERFYRQDKSSTLLGHVQYVEVEPNIVVANMIAQSGFGGAAVRLDYLKECLKKVAAVAKAAGATVHMPRIGTGFGGRRWNEIGPIVQKCMEGVDVYVYTPVQN